MRKSNIVWLGDGLSCLACGKYGIDGYEPNKTLKGNWKASNKTTPCHFCGHSFPAKITLKYFKKFIEWRNSMGGTMVQQNHSLYAQVINLIK